MREIVYILLLLFLLIGCSNKSKEAIVPKPPKKENNETTIKVVTPPLLIEEIIEEEPIVEDIYKWRVNDELISSGTATKIVVVKSNRVMVLLNKDGDILSRHRISLGKNSVGTKLKQGDYKTPEGTYQIIDKRPDKVYYRELLLDYPHKDDIARSKKLGFSAGGGITIHSQPKWNWDGHGDDYTLSNDWTEGCIAISKKGMDIIWNMVALGTEIEIRE